MSEAFGLVNALSGIPRLGSSLCSEIPFSAGHSGRTVALTLKFGAANG